MYPRLMALAVHQRAAHVFSSLTWIIPFLVLVTVGRRSGNSPPGVSTPVSWVCLSGSVFACESLVCHLLFELKVALPDLLVTKGLQHGLDRCFTTGFLMSRP